MPPPSSGGQSQQDNSMGPFWIFIGIFAFCWAVWYFAHEEIASILLRIRLVEAEFIRLFTSEADSLVGTIKATSAANTTFTNLAEISEKVGDYFRFPLAIIMALLAVIIYFGNANLRFKRTYSMKTLADAEQNNWPQITPVVKLDLVNTDIDTGPWAMALTPMQFAKKNNLLILERTVSSDNISINRTKITATLKREDAYKLFAMQLGKLWTGADNLNIQTKTLFAVFAARAGRDREGASKLLLQIAASTQSGKLDFSGVEELFQKHKNNKAVNAIVDKHAFVLTVMGSLLLLARQDGVLATADFLWLKPLDRSLWFMLNSMGRQTPFTEVAGPFAHWLAERKANRKLLVPMVEESVNALENALKDIIYIPDEESTESEK